MLRSWSTTTTAFIPIKATARVLPYYKRGCYSTVCATAWANSRKFVTKVCTVLDLHCTVQQLASFFVLVGTVNTCRISVPNLASSTWWYHDTIVSAWWWEININKNEFSVRHSFSLYLRECPKTCDHPWPVCSKWLLIERSHHADM